MTTAFRYKPAPRQDDPPYRQGEPVAMFIPCYVDQFYPGIGEAMVRILERLGVPLVFPAEQTCCGQPAFNSGYWDESRPVIRQFCKVFAPLSLDHQPVGLLHGHVPGVLSARRFQRGSASRSAAGCSSSASSWSTSWA